MNIFCAESLVQAVENSQWLIYPRKGWHPKIHHSALWAWIILPPPPPICTTTVFICQALQLCIVGFMTRAIHIKITRIQILLLMLCIASSISGETQCQYLWFQFHVGGQGMHTAIEDWNQRRICEFLCLKNISWKFFLPCASWGTCHQINMQDSNSIARATTGEWRVLSIVMADVQAILNFRPLTPVSNDPKQFFF